MSLKAKTKAAKKGKKIALKFRGKKFNAKTNKNGVAKFKIPKNVINKLKVGKKYRLVFSYGKSKLYKKIKVKR